MTGWTAMDPVRLWSAWSLLLAYAGLCAWTGWRWRRVTRQRAQARRALQPVAEGVVTWTVAYASQTGNAEQLAEQTAQTLRLAGVPVALCPLDELTSPHLSSAERLLLVLSTYGEGDPPDNGARFARDLMGQSLDLSHLHHAVLALGDTSYQRPFGFGRVVDEWLQAQGAQSLFGRIEVDQCDERAIAQWRQQLSHMAGTSDAPDWSGPAFSDWRLVAREHLNPNSQGQPVYHLEFELADGELPAWQAGDLVQVMPPADGSTSRPREYSIASIAIDGRVHLLVRLHRREDGGQGLVSAWLTQGLPLHATVSMRIREHKAFRLQGNEHRPLILIGNGTGMAGLRAHLKARAQQRLQSMNTSTPPCWLIFGERQAAIDYHHREDILRWQSLRVLHKVDAVFSRDQAERVHVQDRLRAQSADLKSWIDQGAAIYVCGSLEGIASGVDRVLRDVVGEEAIDQLTREGRYRRDVY